LVAEVDEVRQVMHLGPHHALPRSPTRPHRFKKLRVGPYLRMTVDTGLGRRYSRVARFLYRRVTVLALQPQTLHMMLVTEWHRLVRALPLPSHPRGSLQLVQRHSQGD